MQIYLKSTYQFMKYHAYKKVSHQRQQDPHQKQYVPLPFGGRHKNYWSRNGKGTKCPVTKCTIVMSTVNSDDFD